MQIKSKWWKWLLVTTLPIASLPAAMKNNDQSTINTTQSAPVVNDPNSNINLKSDYYENILTESTVHDGLNFPLKENTDHRFGMIYENGFTKFAFGFRDKEELVDSLTDINHGFKKKFLLERSKDLVISLRDFVMYIRGVQNHDDWKIDVTGVISYKQTDWLDAQKITMQSSHLKSDMHSGAEEYPLRVPLFSTPKIDGSRFSPDYNIHYWGQDREKWRHYLLNYEYNKSIKMKWDTFEYFRIDLKVQYIQNGVVKEVPDDHLVPYQYSSVWNIWQKNDSPGAIHQLPHGPLPVYFTSENTIYIDYKMSNWLWLTTNSVSVWLTIHIDDANQIKKRITVPVSRYENGRIYFNDKYLEMVYLEDKSQLRITNIDGRSILIQDVRFYTSKQAEDLNLF